MRPESSDAPAPRRLHSDLWIALAILAGCVAIYWLTTTFDSMPAALVPGMGAQAFPRLLLGVIAALALILAWASRGRPDEAREPIPAIVYLTVVAMLGFMAVLWAGGMVVAMLVGFVGMGLLWGERRWGRLVLCAVALAGFIYLLFTKGFGIPLPRGLLGEWLF